MLRFRLEFEQKSSRRAIDQEGASKLYDVGDEDDVCDAQRLILPRSRLLLVKIMIRFWI